MNKQHQHTQKNNKHTEQTTPPPRKTLGNKKPLFNTQHQKTEQTTPHTKTI